MADMIFGGIEGGATHSSCALFDAKGKKLTELSGPNTNHWGIGMEECQDRIANMVNDAKARIGLDLGTPLAALGLSLSGCEEDKTNRLLQEGLERRFPTLSSKYVVCSDTLGAIASANEGGGIVLISGTGSNALLLNPDGTQARCGGWGHMIGDEGSAFWIAHKAVCGMFHEQDNFSSFPYNSDTLWRLIQEHFDVDNRFNLLNHVYDKFSKSYFAGLCKRIADAAHAGDELCLWLFSEAGRVLAEYIQALVPSVHADLVRAPGGVPVVCVGSVWKSWDLLHESFVAQLRRGCRKGDVVPNLTLMSLTSSGAIGATLLAAKSVSFSLPCEYSANYNVFFEYKSEPTTNGKL
ncbi:N-acetyl-D-glucosamine kinase [Frankliniella occidentalis]|uniref:N-acetyl-D-glucosamine kinase n=1 Tax=Frankliniella occidentalis TaxID=133901 RepID=A0A6J1SHG5_FRAOC|nr:N-acetyl-D-glucosamine kinase [Frankliniella occidentalis]